jgi:Ca2+-binding RTX toxin-like protein
VRYTTDAGLEIVNGGNGDDTLVAGYGDLRLSGGSGADSFRFGEERYDIAPGASPYSLYAGQRATITDFSRAEGDRIVIDAVDPASAAFTETPPDAVGEWGFYRDAGDLHARYIFAEEEYEWARDPQSYLLDIDIRFADYSGSLAQSDFAFV